MEKTIKYRLFYSVEEDKGGKYIHITHRLAYNDSKDVYEIMYYCGLCIPVEGLENAIEDLDQVFDSEVRYIGEMPDDKRDTYVTGIYKDLDTVDENTELGNYYCNLDI